MEVNEILSLATIALNRLKGEHLELIELGKPSSVTMALENSKILSKLSPLVGNLLEIRIADYLNSSIEFSETIGTWKRQDPGFPDVVFDGVQPNPGIEIKAWFPFATEITGRFKDSQNALSKGNINLAVIAWIPEKVFFGKPKILDVVIIPAASIAESRDNHYQNPPEYLVIEPEDTSGRTRNLQQTNTNGYKFQGNSMQAEEAEKLYQSILAGRVMRSCDDNYQSILKEIQAKYPYRLDTNFAKIDRIQNLQLEEFKQSVLSSTVNGFTIARWSRLLRNEDALSMFLKSSGFLNAL